MTIGACVRYKLCARTTSGARGTTTAAAALTTTYRVAGRGPNALRKRSRKALIGHTGARGLGCRPLCQPHPAICLVTFGSWAMIEIGTSRLAPSPLTVVAG